MKKKNLTEDIIHGIFLIIGLITVGCVLFITIYLVISGLPAIKEIGIIDFLFGTEWAFTSANAKFGILPFILTSIYGMAGALIIGVPIGFFTEVFLSKSANKVIRNMMENAINLLAGIPSVVYGLVIFVIMLFDTIKKTVKLKFI